MKNLLYLTTFNTHRERCKFLSMPFGLRMSQDIFQEKIDETYEKCRGAVGISDDINVFGTELTHDCNLLKQWREPEKQV